MARGDTPPVHGVEFGDLRRVSPISRGFGYARGTPVDRYYIERFLEENAAAVTGRVLEFGDRTYTTRFGEDRVRQSDVLHVHPGSPEATIVADIGGGASSIASDAFDCIICTQTLQLIYDVRAAVATLHRILRPGGVVLATFPGISQTDDTNWNSSWCWSFTPVSARRLFGEAFGAGRVVERTYGNVFTAVCFLHGLAAEELTADEFEAADPAFPFLITVRAAK